MIKNYFRKKVFEHQLSKSSLPVKIIVGADGERLPGWLSTEKDFFDITKESDWKKYFDFKQKVSPPFIKTKTRYEERVVGGVKRMIPVLDPVGLSASVEMRMEVISHILCEEIVQDLEISEVREFLRLAYDYLTPKGRIRISVPDANHPNKEYQKNIVEKHKQQFNYMQIIRMLREAGFNKPSLKEGYINDGMFNISTWYMVDGLVKRSFWYDPRNMEVLDGYLFSSLIVDGIKNIK